MLLISQRSAENYPETFAGAFVKVATHLHEIVGGKLKVEVRHRRVLLRSKQAP